MVRSGKKKCVALQVEEEVITEPDMVSNEGSIEDVIELKGNDNTEEEEVSPYSFAQCYTLTTVQLGELGIEMVVTKLDKTCDLWTMFTDKVWVCFNHGEKFERVYGCWCKVCRSVGC